MEDKFPKQIKFLIWDNGEIAAGFYGKQSEAVVWADDAEHLEYIRGWLKKAFDKIHEFPVHIMTEDETKEDEDEDIKVS